MVGREDLKQMYVVVVDGELVAKGLNAQQVAQLLRKQREQAGKVEIASFNGRQWAPICTDVFLGASKN